MKENSTKGSQFLDQENELDYKKYFNVLKRNLKFIFLTAGSLTVFAFIYNS